MQGQTLVATAGALVAAATVASPQPTEQPVRATRLAELFPVAHGAYLAWAQSTRPLSPRRLSVYVRRPSGRVSRVTRRDGWGLPGSIDGKTLAFVEHVRRRYDLGRFFLYDLRTGRRRALRVPNKAPFLLQPPQLSGHYLLYSGYSQTWLRSLATGHERAIAPGYLATQLSGNFGALFTCDDVSCSVARYSIADSSLTTVLAPDPSRSFSAPSVTRAGTIYGVEDPVGARGHATLVRAPLAGSSSVVFTFPPGTVVVSTWAVSTAAGTTVYYTRARCGSDDYDLYKLVDSS
jgi:hypothetical protein